MADIPRISEEADEVKKLEFRLRLLKEEIASQANIFDQIDNKTGVALGFTFVVVGQVLAAVFHMPAQQHRLSGISLATAYSVNCVFGIASILTLAAFVCGAKAREPRDFNHSNRFDSDQLSESHLTLLRIAVQDFSDIVSKNDRVNEDKGKWAKRTYAFVSLAIAAYLFLTVLLYTIAASR